MFEDQAHDGDPDWEEFKALVDLRASGVDISEALDALLSRRAGRDAEFWELVGDLEPDPGFQVIDGVTEDPRTPEARARRLAFARVHHFDVAQGRFTD